MRVVASKIEAKIERLRIMGQKPIGKVTQKQFDNYNKLLLEILEDMKREYGSSD